MRDQGWYKKVLDDGWEKDQDYVFVSYSSRDWEKVYPCVLALRARGINVYFDFEFEKNGSVNWLKNFQESLFEGSCQGIVAFLSVNYLRSYPCLMEQLANCTYRMSKRKQKPLPMFYVALEPELGSVQRMGERIYENAVQKESARKRIQMTTSECQLLEEFILDSSFRRYPDETSVRKLVRSIRDQHDVATTMYELMFTGAQEMPSILAFEGPEACAQLLADNFTNEKNTSIHLPVLEYLKEATARRCAAAAEEPVLQAAPVQQAEPASREVLPASTPKEADPVASLRARAEAGDPDAQYALGRRYYEGDGLPQSTEQANHWFLLAAEQGHAGAQDDLGDSYLRGDGIEQSAERAVHWFTLAARQGIADSQYDLGCCYLQGEGVEKSLERAAHWYTLAAQRGHAGAQYRLGTCYLRGDGVEKSPEQAFHWFTLAARQDHVLAQNSLGTCCRRGQGTAQDFSQALCWYRKAAEQGNAVAQYNLGGMYDAGEGVEASPERAAAWYRKSAEQGYAHAQRKLAECYEQGRGVVRDPAEAEHWRTLAVQRRTTDSE